MRKLLWIAVALGLSACGGGRAGQAAETCQKAIAEKITDKEFKVDLGEMINGAKEEGADVIKIQAGITFDPGLPREAKQKFECSVRFGDAGTDVIALQFIW